MTTVAFYDTKPYDRQYFERAAGADLRRCRFHEFRLTQETAATAEDASSVCVFVNDRVDRGCLEILRRVGVRHVALRCAGFNNVDLAAAQSLGLAVTRVPSYSPHAVAEHAVALLLTLNRKIHRAYTRVRDQNFSLAGLVGFEKEGLFFEDRSGEILQDDELNLLLSFSNVLVTSHQAFLTREALSEIARVTALNVSGAARTDILPGSRLV